MQRKARLLLWAADGRSLVRRERSAQSSYPKLVQSITPEELRHRLRAGAPPFLLDVREVEEMVDGVVPGSVNIPMGDVEGRLDELPRDRDIVVICHLGARSGHITKRLSSLGFPRAMNLLGGMDAWLGEDRSEERQD